MNPQNQTLLTLIIAASMVSGFLGVYAVTNHYEQTAPISNLFVSDSNTEFYTGYFEGNDIENVTTSMLYVDSGFNWIVTPVVPLYIGNNTWGASMPATVIGPSTATGGRHDILMSPPITQSWFITTITISIFLPTTPSGSELYFTLPYSYYMTTLTGISGWNNFTWDISTASALNIMAACAAGVEPVFEILVESPSGNLILPAHAYQFIVSFDGSLITTWSLQNSINLVIGISIGINIFVGIYMLDSVDFNTKRQDLPKRKGTAKKTTRKTKKWEW